jgi:hypothetical protein
MRPKIRLLCEVVLNGFEYVFSYSSLAQYVFWMGFQCESFKYFPSNRQSEIVTVKVNFHVGEANYEHVFVHGVLRGHSIFHYAVRLEYN